MKGRDTQLLYCTTGILLRRLLRDRNLSGVTHVIIDEIHERGMNEGRLLYCCFFSLNVPLGENDFLTRFCLSQIFFLL